MKGASDAAEITEESCFYLGEMLFPPTATVNCNYCCYSSLSPCFSDWGTVGTVMAGTVDNAETVQNSGWC